MKFRNYLETISGIGILPVISLLIFFLFFSALLVWVVKSRKQHFTDMEQLPLEDGSENLSLSSSES